MSNYNPFLNLMGMRFGYDLTKYPNGTQDLIQKNLQDGVTSSNVQDNREKLLYDGGYMQQERMVYNKRKTLDRAVKYSYQGATIKKIGVENSPYIRALINPDKLKQDFDSKILSVGSEWDFKPGEVFEWCGTGTAWMVYLQEVNETAYFRAEIRRCSFQISWKDEDGEHSSYVVVTGPNERSISSSTQHGIQIDKPNATIEIMMPKNDETMKFFTRYARFYIKDENQYAPKVCWEVAGVNWMNPPGILTVYAKEDYQNKTEDDIENGVVGGLVVKPELNTELTDTRIKGESFIRPKKTYQFEYTGTRESNWEFNRKDLPLKYKVDKNNPKIISIYWDSNYTGEFKISYAGYEKTVVVESLF